MKPISSKYVITKNSALSHSVKINILITDLVRIMRNISPLCSPWERQRHTQDFMHHMQFSGYSQKGRIRVYRGASKKFEEIVVKDTNGTQPRYRNKQWNRLQRISDKTNRKNTWYNTDKFQGVMFIDATKHRELARRFRKILKSTKLKINVIAKPGRSIRSIICKTYPFRRTRCVEENCIVYKYSPGINCKTRNVVYRISCMDGDCKNGNTAYIGEMARSLTERVNEHWRDYKNHKQTSVLYQHAKEQHSGVLDLINIEILSSHPDDALLRQIKSRSS
ncbi:uncharacterized protein LOC128248506 [Octopus bimaculoides]|uniref:uncharacterized protein LOC128248506 n=1 Tax=Octopus bimaculoides TaxID=37653 RepID=UPI0022E1F695|nr:uncharacterized protein LOC128248506 [Octopus bimaculoides]